MNMAFTYALNTSCIRDLNLSVEEEIRIAAEAGYDGIELWVSEIDQYVESGTSLETLKETLDRHNLTVPNLIAFFNWGSPDEAERQQGLKEAARVFSMAKRLGCPFVAAPPFGLTERTDIPLKDLAVRFEALMDLADETGGVRPLLEFWRHSQTLGTLKEAMEVLANIQRDDAALLADVFHMCRDWSSYDLLKELPGEQLGLFHVNDFPHADDLSSLTDADRVYPTDGIAPLAQIKQTLKDLNFQGMLSLELFNKEYQQAGAEQVAKLGLEKTKEAFED